jgi:hypothetical protein
MNAVTTTLTWGRGKFIKTVALDKHKNVAIMTTKPGVQKYATFATKVASLEPTVCCFVATGAPQPSVAEVTDDEKSDETTLGHESDSDESTSGDQTTSRTTSSVTSGATSGETSGVTSGMA